MLRLVLSLISSMQVGARIKDTVEQSVRRAVLATIAIVVLLFAIGFGLAAGYHALIGQGLNPLAAACIVAGTLALLGIVLLALALKKPRPKQPDFVNEPAESMAMIDQSVPDLNGAYRKAFWLMESLSHYDPAVDCWNAKRFIQ